jgi:ABC-2 type transport system permease protein
MVALYKHTLSSRREAVWALCLIIVVLVLANVLSQYIYTRLDMTAEKKYSIMPSTKREVKGLDEVVTFKVYLQGDMPAGFRRLRQASVDILNEMRAYGGKRIQYELVDPVNGKSEKDRQAILEQLLSKGLAPANVQTGNNNERKLTMVFPCAIAYYKGREYPIQLLENQIGYTQEEVLNNSVISLEYKLANAIQKLTQHSPPTVAFSTGHGELGKAALADIQQQLVRLKYQISTLDITKGYRIDPLIDALVIPKPVIPFDEKDKYKIDQYIMHGGKVIWMIDATTADFDSLKVSLTGQFVTDRLLNLDDQLFKYGVRINTDLVMDINMCNPIPVKVGSMGNAPQIELMPWYYFPLLIPESMHPIVRNLDPIMSQYASSIDTIRNPGVTKTILLRTTENAKAVMTPARVHFGILQQKPNPQYYNQPQLPVAVLLEGQFQSLYRNRLTADFLAIGDTVASLKYKEVGPMDGKMIVISDGDIIRNEMRGDSTAYPLGFYSVSRQTFANKDFMLNAIQYLTDRSGLLETRNKQVKLRMLNTVRVQAEKTKWQLINILLPIILIILLGMGYNYRRRKRYTTL